MGVRDYKRCAPGEYYHIYNRGNAKDDIFRCDDDYRFFLFRLRQYLGLSESPNRWFEPFPREAFSVIAYCLMPNHFHFVIRQNSEIPTGKFIGRMCASYAKYFNKKYDRVGHLFQDQFKQKNVPENNYLLWLSAYTHRNPVNAHLVRRAEDWQWSSMREYLAMPGSGLTEREIITDQIPGKNYAQWIDEDGIAAEQRLIGIGIL